MKSYRIKIPASVHLTICAENEEQAKKLAVAATYTDTMPLSGCDAENTRYGSLYVSVWINEDSVKCCEIINCNSDIDQNHEKDLKNFAEINANEKFINSLLEK